MKYLFTLIESMNSEESVLLHRKYVVLEPLGEGSFGSLFKGQNRRTKELVAIKIERKNGGFSLLKHEATLYQRFQGSPGIPMVKWFGEWQGSHYMVMDLLGASLAQKKQALGVFSLNLVCKVAWQLLNVLETLHSKGFVHRDVKPDNFLFRESQLYVVDLGFCTSFVDAEGRHKDPRSLANMVGSPNYASVNVHQRISLSRRDDLESMCYVLWFLSVFDGLPWRNDAVEATMEARKRSLLGAPSLVAECLTRVRQLDFREKPDYDGLRAWWMQHALQKHTQS